MFAIEVTLLTERYVATSFDDRDKAEWPPHPARLFSALVATYFETQSAPEHRAALEWLETQGAPTIAASDAFARDVVTHFVPVNDPTVIGSFDKEDAAVDEARQALLALKSIDAKAKQRAQLSLGKAEARLQQRIKGAIQPSSGVPGKEEPRTAASLLPERRLRQPRTFPSVKPHSPSFVFAWPDARPTDAQRSHLDLLASQVVRLGHSSCLVSLRVVDTSPEPTWVPNDEAGDAHAVSETLRIVAPGQMDRLCESFDRQADVAGRVLPARFQRYVRPRPSRDQAIPRGAFGEDWIILRRLDGPRLPSTRVVEVARTLRNALLESFGPGAPEIISGHRAPNVPSATHHLAYVPLPFVGHAHADGSILGVALVFPRETSEADRLLVYRTLASWEDRLRDPDVEAPRLPLLMGRAGVVGVQRLDGASALETLKAKTWCHPSTHWVSTTPVALDRNPGDLRSSKPSVAAAAFAEAEAIVSRACANIGLPSPELVEILPAAPLAGAPKTRNFPAFRTGKPSIQRVLVHAALRFSAPVAGPILLGAGRYFGLGLFRPVRNRG